MFKITAHCFLKLTKVLSEKIYQHVIFFLELWEGNSTVFCEKVAEVNSLGSHWYSSRTRCTWWKTLGMLVLQWYTFISVSVWYCNGTHLSQYQFGTVMVHIYLSISLVLQWYTFISVSVWYCNGTH